MTTARHTDRAYQRSDARRTAVGAFERLEPVQARERSNTIDDFAASMTASPVQMQGLDAALLQFRQSVMSREQKPADVHATAAGGMKGASSKLPHLDTIQNAFGRHDVSDVQAFTGTEANTAARSMGARAYATNGGVVLGDGGKDLHTVAHEAAHVVQQRGGVSLAGGVGKSGDSYERHADEVADKVVRGESAESLLDRMAGGGASIAKKAVQFGDDDDEDMDDEVDGSPPDAPPEVAAAAEEEVGTGGDQVADELEGEEAPETPQLEEAEAAEQGGGNARGQSGDSQREPSNEQAVERAPNSLAGEEGMWASVVDTINGPWGNVVRTGLEFTRIIPVVGAVTGLGADVLEGIQNYETIANCTSPRADSIRTMLMARQAIVVVNNLIAHVGTVSEQIQDIGTISVVGVEVDLATAPINEIVGLLNFIGDGSLVIMDTLIAVTADAEGDRLAATDQTQAQEMQNLEETFWWNVGADCFAVLLDVVNLATLGFANANQFKSVDTAVANAGEAVESGAQAMNPVMKAFTEHWTNLKGLFDGGNWGALADVLRGADDVSWKAIEGIVAGVGRLTGSTGLINAIVNIWGTTAVSPTEVPPVKDAGADTGQAAAAPPAAAPAQAAPVQRQALQRDGDEEVDQAALDQANRSIGEQVLGLAANGALLGIDLVQGGIDSGQQGYESFAQTVEGFMEGAEDAMREFLDGQDPFVFFRDKAVEGLEEMNSKLGTFATMAASALDVQSLIEQGMAKLDEVEAMVDAIQLPTVTIPEVELGDNMLANAAEGLLNTGAEAAEAVANRVIAQLQRIIDAVKSYIRQQIAALREESAFWMDVAGRFNVAMNMRIESMTAIVNNFTTQLASCQNVEDIFNTIMAQATEFVGGQAITLDDIREGFSALITNVEELLAFARTNVEPFAS